MKDKNLKKIEITTPHFIEIRPANDEKCDKRYVQMYVTNTHPSKAIDVILDRHIYKGYGGVIYEGTKTENKRNLGPGESKKLFCSGIVQIESDPTQDTVYKWTHNWSDWG